MMLLKTFESSFRSNGMNGINGGKSAWIPVSRGFGCLFLLEEFDESGKKELALRKREVVQTTTSCLPGMNHSPERLPHLLGADKNGQGNYGGGEDDERELSQPSVTDVFPPGAYNAKQNVYGGRASG
jgi:hypothetical protein